MEDKLGTILNNPQLMQQIMSMAQSLANSSPAEGERKQNDLKEQKQEVDQPDLSVLQKLSGYAGQSGINREEKQLLQALSPYLRRDRIIKLENAMRAAKMAQLASSFLGNGGIQSLIGR